MQKRLYMHQNRKNFWVILGVTLLIGAANTAIILFVDPKSVWIEIGELVLLCMFLVIAISWSVGKLKWGLIVTGAILSGLILRRTGWFGWPSVGAELVIFGLISLFN